MKLIVEVADNHYRQSKGLMFRESLGEDEGMLFKFDRPSKLKFWNLNTYIPLDIAFVDKNYRITQIAQINPTSPETAFRPQTITSDQDCPYAIEANMGFFAKNKIGVGYEIEMGDHEGNVAEVRFFRRKSAQQLVDKPDELPPDRLPSTLNKVQTTAHEFRDGLPVIDEADLQGILEDSFDENDQSYQPPSEEPQEPFPVPDEDEYPNIVNPAEGMQFATDQLEVVRIWYQTQSGRDIERSVEPHGEFIAKTTGNRIVVTFDRTVGDIRAFIVNNILYFNFEGEKFNRKFFVKQ